MKIHLVAITSGFLGVFGALALSACTPARHTAPPDSAELQREIEAVNRAMESAVNTGPTEAAADFYADNAVIRSARRVEATGRNEIRRYFAGVGPAKWRLDVLQVGGDPDAPYQVGRSTLIHGTRPDTSVVHFVVYWRRQSDGSLKIELDYYH